MDHRPSSAGIGAATGGSAAARLGSHVAIEVWLLAVAALVLLTVAVGGATRLTDSGLSITEWRPLVGVVPPLSAADWQDAFAKYQLTTEYKLVNKGMSLGAFKVIYWWEWSHRLLGRLIAVAFAGPLLWFWIGGRIPAGLMPKLLGVLALGGLQGFVGWYMVRSGLSDRVDVSQYRLALHLALAVAILGFLIWLALGLRAEADPAARDSNSWRRRVAAGLLAMIFLQIVLGALVAGLDAGLTYNTWPLMDGRLIPNGLFTLEPWVLNAFENVTTVQFNHRTFAFAVLLVAVWHACSLWQAAGDRRPVRSAVLVTAALLAQAALGVWTLIAVAPLHLALAHQMGALAVFALAVWHLRRMTDLRG